MGLHRSRAGESALLLYVHSHVHSRITAVSTPLCPVVYTVELYDRGADFGTALARDVHLLLPYYMTVAQTLAPHLHGMSELRLPALESRR